MRPVRPNKAAEEEEEEGGEGSEMKVNVQVNKRELNIVVVGWGGWWGGAERERVCGHYRSSV